MPIESQLATKDETTYGTAVTVDRFQPYLSESLAPELFRTRTPALRANKTTNRSDEYAAGVTGVAGSLEMPVYSKSFGLWLKRALGAVATTGPTGGAYQHVGTIDPDACLPSFTTQVNRALAPCGSTDGPWTVEGCQIDSFELAVSVDEMLVFNCEILAEDGTSGTSLAAANYATGMEPLSWAGASLTVAGTSLPVMSFSLKCSNNLKGDRLYLRSNTRRAQAPRDDFPEITVEFEADFDSWTQFNRALAETASGTQAAVVFTCNAPTAIGTSGTYPGVTITMPCVDFTEVQVGVGGAEMLTQSITGLVLDNGTDEAISIAYRTSDGTA
jgi:hypothetical protein